MLSRTTRRRACKRKAEETEEQEDDNSSLRTEDAPPVMQGTSERIDVEDDHPGDEDGFVMDRSYVRFNIYFAGERPLMPHERDLRYEFVKERIYLIRGVRMANLSAPLTSMAEALAMSMIGHGQATWTQLRRLIGLLPCDANLRWKQCSENKGEVRKFTAGAWVHGPMAGLHTNTQQYPWTARALAGIVRTWDDEFPFTSCSLILNVQAPAHVDKNQSSGFHESIAAVLILYRWTALCAGGPGQLQT